MPIIANALKSANAGNTPEFKPLTIADKNAVKKAIKNDFARNWTIYSLDIEGTKSKLKKKLFIIKNILFASALLSLDRVNIRI